MLNFLNPFAYISFGGGLVVATVVWFFVLRNNKKMFMKVLEDGWFETAIAQIEDLADDVRAKVMEEFNKLKDRL